MSWASSQSRLSASAFSRFGEAATYTPVDGAAIATTAITTYDMAAAMDHDPQITQKHRILDLPDTDVAAAKRDDAVTVSPANGAPINYAVERLLKREPGFVKVLVRLA